MSNLKEELEQLSHEKQVNVGEVWSLPKKELQKKKLLPILEKILVDEYYIKGVLEKLTPLQVKIYTLIIKSNTILTLGEISRKIRMQPINVEKELAVLKYLLLVYQRKNRERITSNLDRYYPFEEISKLISTSTNQNAEKFKISIKREIQFKRIEDLDKKYIYFVTKGKKYDTPALIEKVIEDDAFKNILASVSEQESVLIDEAFNNGGILEIHSARIILDEQKLDPEITLKKLDSLNLLKDTYYIDERFVRILSMPVEIFNYLVRNPIFIKEQGIKEQQDKIACNELDFILNLKKLLLFISNKGVTLSQSEKIKQSDRKKSEEYLISIDMNLFREKSQVYQIEIILPFLKLFELVAIKEENIILQPAFEEFLSKDPMDILKSLMELIVQASERRMVGNEVFLPIEVPFYKKEVIGHCVKIIHENGGVYSKVMIAQNIRENVILSPQFRITNFKSEYLRKRSFLLSSLFYMHLFGLLNVKYPQRWIELSPLGQHIFFEKELVTQDTKGALYVNPDATIMVMPDKLSIFSIHLLKSFTEIKGFDNVYTFQISKDSLQEGVLLGDNISEFKDLLTNISKNEIPQNIIFLIAEWTNELPIVHIEEGIVLLETSQPKLKEMLIGSLRDKDIIRRDISPTAMVIKKKKIPEVMATAEKLEMIVKLIR